MSPRPRATGHFSRNSASAQWVEIYIRKTTFHFLKNFTVLMQASMLKHILTIHYRILALLGPLLYKYIHIMFLTTYHLSRLSNHPRLRISLAINVILGAISIS